MNHEYIQSPHQGLIKAKYDDARHKNKDGS